MSRVSLPHDAKAGPTKPEVRAVLASKLALTGSDHFAEVGSCTGAVTITAARRAGRVTALERKGNRLDVTRKNLAANDVDADVELREAEAPEACRTTPTPLPRRVTQLRGHPRPRGRDRRRPNRDERLAARSRWRGDGGLP